MTILLTILLLFLSLASAYMAGYWNMLNEFTHNNYAGVFQDFPKSVFQHDYSQRWKWKGGLRQNGEAFRFSSTILVYRTDFNHYTWLWFKRWIGAFVFCFSLVVYLTGFWYLAWLGYFAFILPHGFAYESLQAKALKVDGSLNGIFEKYLLKWEAWNSTHANYEDYVLNEQPF